ncbi:unnamed protein product [Mytilus edulis]|uniref:DDE Tnp4 domain-containing protein n=1 Tax=Mytilus edulis TaxID=6550 RepID=A0A8S3TCL2_MYTED|nr:unnamed protein product [Mytilus edulis]
MITEDSENFVLYKPFTEDLDQISTINHEEKENIREKAKLAITDYMRSLNEMEVFINETYLKHTRPGLGVGSWDRGMDYYKACLKWHTSLQLSPEEVHRKGLEEVSRISTQMKAIFRKMGMNGSIKDGFNQLKNDSSYFLKTEDEVVSTFEDIIERQIEPKLNTLFKDNPNLPLVVEPMPYNGPLGMYLTGSPDGTKPGTFQVNGLHPSEIMPPLKCYPCVVCCKRTKTAERRNLSGEKNKEIRKYLVNKLFIRPQEVIEGVTCNKCRLFCGKEIQKKPTTKRNAEYLDKDPDFIPVVRSSSKHYIDCRSPPSIQLKFPSTTASHAQCVVCKRHGPKLVTVPNSARYDLFLKRLIILPQGARCCPGHLSGEYFSGFSCEQIVEKKSSSDFNRTEITNLLKQIRDIALKNSKKRIDFDSPTSLSESDIYNLTGLTKANFDDVCSKIQDSPMRDSHCRTIRQCIGIFLTKLKCGMSNRLLSTLFNLGRDATRRAISSARKYLVETFVPENLGFEHISRNNVINNHTRPLAQSLFGDITKPAILVVDGTYIYIQKSGNFQFQRRSFSMHKHRPLVKPMVFVTTSGYIVSVMGPYMGDGKNNDANIMTHIIKRNIEKITDWLQEDDILIVDRGFRDSLDLLNELGIKSEMPSFLGRGEKQHSVEESNTTRLVTKLRWIVESINVENDGLDKRSYKWSKIDSTDFDIEFPRLNEEELRNLTLGTYQLKMAKSYTEEHFDSEGRYEVLISAEDQCLLSAKIQSRHISAKCYQLWISFNECVVLGWYCKCKIGGRVVGMCSHIASVIWYLGFGRYTDKQFRINNWGQYLLDAKNIPEPEEIDASDDEATVTEE